MELGQHHYRGCVVVAAAVVEHSEWWIKASPHPPLSSNA